jgi:hypothetical protein
VIIKIFLTSSSQTDNRDPKTKKNKESKKPNYDDEDQLKEEAGPAKRGSRRTSNNKSDF